MLNEEQNENIADSLECNVIDNVPFDVYNQNGIPLLGYIVRKMG